jgi:hypothetical protein
LKSSKSSGKFEMKTKKTCIENYRCLLGWSSTKCVEKEVATLLEPTSFKKLATHAKIKTKKIE